MSEPSTDSRLEDWLASLEKDVFSGDHTEDRCVRGLGEITPLQETERPSKRNWIGRRTKPLKEDCLPMKESFLKLVRSLVSLSNGTCVNKQSVKDKFTQIKGIIEKYLCAEKSPHQERLSVGRKGSDEPWIDTDWEHDMLEEKMDMIHSELTSIILMSTDLKLSGAQPVFAKKPHSAEAKSDEERLKEPKGLQQGGTLDGILLKESEQFSDLVVMVSLSNNDSPLWNASVFDPGSETRTVDNLDTSDESNLKGALSTILAKVIDVWQSERAEVEQTIKEVSKESGDLQDLVEIEANQDLLERLSHRVSALWWGQEKVELQAKVFAAIAAFESSKTSMQDVKSMVAAFLKKGAYPLKHQGRGFAKELAVSLVEKHKLADLSKAGTKDLLANFKLADEEFSQLIKKWPTRDDWEGFQQLLLWTAEEIAAVALPRLNLRLMQEIDAYFEALVSAFKSWAQGPAKPILFETIPLAEAIWEWCEHHQPESSGDLWIPASSMARLRNALSHELGTLEDLTAVQLSSKSKLHPEGTFIRKFWATAPPSKWSQTNGGNSTTKLGQVVAVERLLMGTLKVMATSNFEKLQIDTGAQSKTAILYKKTMGFLESFYNPYLQRDGALCEDYLYFASVMDGIHAAFTAEDYSYEVLKKNIDLQGCYTHRKRRLLSFLKANFQPDLLKELTESFSEQFWMQFQRLSRAKKPTNPRNSMECEALYATWLRTVAKSRAYVKDYVSKSINHQFLLEFVVSNQVDYFSTILEVFTTTGISVQRLAAFVADVKLVVNWIDHFMKIFGNISERQHRSPAKTEQTELEWKLYVLEWNSRLLGADAKPMVFLYRKMQRIRATFKYLYRVLSAGEKEIQEITKQLNSNLYQRRKELTIFPEIIKRSYQLVSNMHQESVLAAGENLDLPPLNTEYHAMDSNRLGETATIINSTSLNPKYAENFDYRGPGIIQDLNNLADVFSHQNFENEMRFFIQQLEVDFAPNHEWFQAMQDYLSSFKDPSPLISKELEFWAKLADETPKIDESEFAVLSSIKKKDLLMRRPELMETDSDLKPQGLSIKNLIKGVY